MVLHKNDNLNPNEDFVIFLTSKLIACFIDSSNSRMKSQIVAYSLSGSVHIYWILDLECEMHSIWDLWTRRPSRRKGQCFSQSRMGRITIFSWVHKKISKFFQEATLALSIPPSTFVWNKIYIFSMNGCRCVVLFFMKLHRSLSSD